jgi:dephospho-CoA kinase
MSETPKDIPVIGLVGGIGAGKSTAAASFAMLGCTLLDADRIGHELLQRGDVREDIRQRWGQDVFTPDGDVDRAALGEKVFADPDELAALNAIMHPRIRSALVAGIDEARSRGADAVVLDAAVLFEAAWDDLCTTVVFVSAGDEQRVQRVHTGRGWDRPTWESRERRQKSLDFKAGKCHYTLDNSSSVSHLRAEVRKLLDRIVHAVDQPAEPQ